MSEKSQDTDGDLRTDENLTVSTVIQSEFPTNIDPLPMSNTADAAHDTDAKENGYEIFSSQETEESNCGPDIQSFMTAENDNDDAEVMRQSSESIEYQEHEDDGSVATENTENNTVDDVALPPADLDSVDVHEGKEFDVENKETELLWQNDSPKATKRSASPPSENDEIPDLLVNSNETPLSDSVDVENEPAMKHRKIDIVAYDAEASQDMFSISDLHNEAESADASHVDTVPTVSARTKRIRETKKRSSSNEKSALKYFLHCFDCGFKAIAKSSNPQELVEFHFHKHSEEPSKLKCNIYDSEIDGNILRVIEVFSTPPNTCFAGKVICVYVVCNMELGKSGRVCKPIDSLSALMKDDLS